MRVILRRMFCLSAETNARRMMVMLIRFAVRFRRDFALVRAFASQRGFHAAERVRSPAPPESCRRCGQIAAATYPTRTSTRVMKISLRSLRAISV